MHLLLRRFLLLPVVLLVIAGEAGATVAFRTLGWSQSVSGLHFTSGGKTVPLSVDENALSATYILAGGGPLELQRLETVNGKIVRKPVASLPVPPGLTRALLLLRVAGDGTCSGQWLDDSPEATPAGTMRIHNLSSKEVAVNVGEEVRTLDRGNAVSVSFPVKVRSVPVRIATRAGDGWDYALSISQPVRARLRFMVLIRDARPTIDEPDRILDWLAFHETPRI